MQNWKQQATLLWPGVVVAAVVATAATFLATNWPEQRLMALGPATGGQVFDAGHVNDFAVGASCP